MNLLDELFADRSCGVPGVLSPLTLEAPEDTPPSAAPPFRAAFLFIAAFFLFAARLALASDGMTLVE